MQFLDTLPFAKADPGQEARVSTLWQARSQRKNPEIAMTTGRQFRSNEPRGHKRSLPAALMTQCLVYSAVELHGCPVQSGQLLFDTVNVLRIMPKQTAVLGEPVHKYMNAVGSAWMERFHRVAFNLSLLRKIEFPWPSTINRTTHPTSGSHEGGLWFQAAVGGLSVRHIS